jgi:hypothetical protein
VIVATQSNAALCIQATLFICMKRYFIHFHGILSSKISLFWLNRLAYPHVLDLIDLIDTSVLIVCSCRNDYVSLPPN